VAERVEGSLIPAENGLDILLTDPLLSSLRCGSASRGSTALIALNCCSILPVLEQKCYNRCMYEPVRKALFPGVLAGIICLLMIANLASNPSEALAATVEPAAQAQAVNPIPPAADNGPLSPLDILVRIFAPFIYKNDLPPAEPTPEPQPEPQVEQQAENDDHESSSNGGCAVGSGFSENVRRWCDLITRTAHEHGIDANLIAAVMTVESAGNPDAYSRSGAVGLMQVMPRDGLAASFTCVNGPCFANRPSMNELYDPEFNLQYAGGMLAGLFNRHGSWRDALFAYGPTGTGYSYADKVLGVYERNK
jgi:hypothetical protein